MHILLVLAIMLANLCRAEAFGNNALLIPKLGVYAFDGPLLRHKKPWGLSHQWNLGFSFIRAIDYRWWWVSDSTLGFGHMEQGKKLAISSFSIDTGIRYNIFHGDFRPNIGLVICYLQFLGAGAKTIPLELGYPIFLGLKPYFGLEWLFYSEMAVLADAGYGFYFNFNQPFRRILQASLGFMFYF